MAPNDPVRIVEWLATQGLLESPGSIPYVLAEIEAHNHNWERWFGAAAAATPPTHAADRIGVGVASFQIDAGNNNWGNWVQLLGSNDTPAEAGMAKFDLHRVMIIGAERDETYYFQLGFGASGAAALAAGTYSEVVYKPVTGLFPEVPIILQTHRQNAGTPAWARCLCPLQNTATLSFFIGLHEYRG